MRASILVLLVVAFQTWAEGASDSDPPGQKEGLTLSTLSRTHAPDLLDRRDYSIEMSITTNALGEEKILFYGLEDKSWMVRHRSKFYSTNGVYYCSVHNEELQEDIVPIRYGLPLAREGYEGAWASEMAEFPNAYTHDLGGCVVRPDSPKERRVLYCASCRKRCEKWFQERARQLAQEEKKHNKGLVDTPEPLRDSGEPQP